MEVPKLDFPTKNPFPRPSNTGTGETYRDYVYTTGTIYRVCNMFLIYYGDGNGIWNLLVIFSTSRWLTWSWPSSNPVPVPVIIYWLTILNRKPSYPTAMSHWKTLPCRVMKIGWWCLVTNPSISGTKDPGCLNPSWTPARWQRFRCLVDPFADRWETSFKIIHTQATGWVVEMHENAGEFFFL